MNASGREARASPVIPYRVVHLHGNGDLPWGVSSNRATLTPDLEARVVIV